MAIAPDGIPRVHLWKTDYWELTIDGHLSREEFELETEETLCITLSANMPLLTLEEQDSLIQRYQAVGWQEMIITPRYIHELEDWTVRLITPPSGYIKSIRLNYCKLREEYG